MTAHILKFFEKRAVIDRPYSRNTALVRQVNWYATTHGKLLFPRKNFWPSVVVSVAKPTVKGSSREARPSTVIVSPRFRAPKPLPTSDRGFVPFIRYERAFFPLSTSTVIHTFGLIN